MGPSCASPFRSYAPVLSIGMVLLTRSPAEESDRLTNVETISSKGGTMVVLDRGQMVDFTALYASPPHG